MTRGGAPSSTFSRSIASPGLTSTTMSNPSASPRRARASSVSSASASGPGSSIGLREAQSRAGGEHDRYSVGLHHLALEASSRAAVDERAAWLRRTGAEIESGPQEYAYSLGYYAVFFYDPDGIKLEIVHVPRHAA